MRKWTAAVAVVALSNTFAACSSDDDVDVPEVSTPLDETIETAVDSMVDSVTDSETADTEAPMDTSVASTRPPTAGGSPGTTPVGSTTADGSATSAG